MIVSILAPYRKDDCELGRIDNKEDFKHVARKLTKLIMEKEMRAVSAGGPPPSVTKETKKKATKFIAEFMSKFGEQYSRV